MLDTFNNNFDLNDLESQNYKVFKLIFLDLNYYVLQDKS